MKTNIVIIRWFFFFLLAFYGKAQAQTNDQYSADILTNEFSLSQNNIFDFIGDEQGHYVDCVVNHKVMPETLPATEDPNGNWGPVTNGLQLSVRFTRGDKYTVSDIMPAMAVLRNLEPSNRALLLTNSPSFFIAYTVRGKNGYLSQRKEETRPRTTDYASLPSPRYGLSNLIFDARSEKAIVIDLNRLFDLSLPGEYSVQAICRIYSPVTKLPLYEVSSGTTSFQIVEKPPAAP
jgi:hypothetical protein